MATDDPIRECYSIGDVCELTDLKPHVLRYWESQIRFQSPAKNRAGNRVYTRRELEFVMLVKHLLYPEKFTIEGAKQQLEQRRKDGGVKAAARQGLDAQTVLLLEQDLLGILQALESNTPTTD